MRKLFVLILIVVLYFCLNGPKPAYCFRVLITNDDGVGSAGISALVTELGHNKNLEITVIAPATNQSRTGDKITTTESIEVTTSKTAVGFAATAVSGFPADTVLFGVLKQLSDSPDVVVSGINYGPNFTDMVKISGTVGAALTAARLGIPAIAVSQGFGREFSSPLDYGAAATYVANIVEQLRTNEKLQSKMMTSNGLNQRLVLNVNFPTCPVGAVRGVKVVPLARFVRIVDYKLIAAESRKKTYQPVVAKKDYVKSTDCNAMLTEPATDYEALINGFATVTPLNPDLTVNSSLRSFKFLEKIDFKR